MTESIFDDLWIDFPQEYTGPTPPYTPRCQLCGKFRRANQMRLVYTEAPYPEPDYEACDVCLDR